MDFYHIEKSLRNYSINNSNAWNSERWDLVD